MDSSDVEGVKPIDLACSQCGAAPGSRCKNRKGREVVSHDVRFRLARMKRADAEHAARAARLSEFLQQERSAWIRRLDLLDASRVVDSGVVGRGMLIVDSSTTPTEGTSCPNPPPSN